MEMNIESLHERLRQQGKRALPVDHFEAVKNEICDCLEKLDDEYILDESKQGLPVKAYSLALKHGGQFDKKLIADRVRVIADVIEVEGDTISIEGRSRIELLGDEYEIYAVDAKGTRYDLEYKDAVFNDFHGLDGKVFFKGNLFKVVFPILDGAEYGFVLQNKQTGEVKPIHMHSTFFSNISTAKRNVYVYNNHIIEYRDKKIKIEKRTAVKELTEKKKFEMMLRKAGRQDLLTIRKNAEKLQKGKPIWLIFDRTDKGDDNGEAFFKYLMKSGAAADYDIYYAIPKDCPDFKRISQYGPVIDMSSSRFKELYLAAEKIISSQWADWAVNPFGPDYKYVQDLRRLKYVFLQHGITKDDISGFAHKTKRNLAMFLTAAPMEYESIVNGNYGYTEKQVKLAGFPRFDTLNDESEKLIVIMPSWRGNMNLVPEEGIKAGFKYSEIFKESDYFKFYNGLINDAGLLEAMKEKGYRGAFCIHPHFAKQTVDFTANDVFEIKKIPFSYQEMFAKGSVLVTDYSSVAFDFAYMKKPVVYSQFDRETFYEGHTYNQGYFSYERDGFGPVCTDYESAVKTITDLVMNDCREPEEYRQRVETFFAFTDKDNCRRVFEEIRGL